ncbi:MAG: hypothetical protein JSR63_02005 [Proteobacteria bacterium]|nr:hypothetical protein [Pseudomonadota bacterium]
MKSMIQIGRTAFTIHEVLFLKWWYAHLFRDELITPLESGSKFCFGVTIHAVKQQLSERFPIATIAIHIFEYNPPLLHAFYSNIEARTLLCSGRTA